ncbi:hypothetical protein [Alicyclobacillus contaminans]|nr:hypothetical protein [Alicyclobacillus contaminans]
MPFQPFRRKIQCMIFPLRQIKQDFDKVGWNHFENILDRFGADEG